VSDGAAPDRGHLLTEQANPRSSDLDALSTEALVDLFCQEDRRPQQAVAAAAPALTLAIDAVAARLRSGGRLFYLGAGTSGRLGVLDAAECPPTFCSDPSLVQGVLAGGAPALLRSSEGLEDDAAAGIHDLQARSFGPGDCLVGIAAGGTTPYVLGALEHARQIGALAIAMACVPSTQAAMPCDIDIRLLTGPELLTGSTRLKAGTATKMALNAITTAMFVRLGKTYGNLMVDVAATNDKLVDRAARIYREFFPADSREQSHVMLESAGGMLKVAIVMRAKGVARAEAESILAARGGNLRAVIG